MADIPDSRLLRLTLKAWKLFTPGSDKWNVYSESQFKDFLEGEFTDVHQKKANCILELSGERVLLTVGTKKEVNKNV